MDASRTYYTYLHCKPDGEPFYVGKGVDKFYEGHGTDRRCFSKKNRNKHHRNITAKYGWENILVYVFPCISEVQAFADEIQQIAQLRREGFKLVNITDGGEGPTGWVPTVETRLKIATALHGKKRGPHSAAHKANLSKANKGQVPSNACKLASSVANTGRAPWNKGKTYSIKDDSGRPHGNIDKRHSAKTRAKVSAAVTEVWRKRKAGIFYFS